MTTGGLDGVVVAAALLSAFLHAGWNAAVKSTGDANGAMMAQVVGSGILAAPFLFILPLPPPAAWPWVAGSVCINIMAMTAMVKGYSTGAFGVVYPLTRAVSPVMVTLLGAVLIADIPSALGVAGVVVVSLGVALFALGQTASRAAVGYATLAGVLGAGYIVCDAQGARLSPSTLGYGCLLSVLNGVVFGALFRLRSGAPMLGSLIRHWRVVAFGSTAAMSSYLLILWVYTQAPVAVGAALRDTSLVFAALIAVFVLKERLTTRTLAAIGVVAAGVVVLRFA